MIEKHEGNIHETMTMACTKCYKTLQPVLNVARFSITVLKWKNTKQKIMILRKQTVTRLKTVVKKIKHTKTKL